jgi:hypothetical protein
MVDSIILTIMFFFKGPLSQVKRNNKLCLSKKRVRERERERGMAASIPTTLPYGDGDMANPIILILY